MSLQIIDWAIVLPLLFLSVSLTFVRLVKGPSLPDRVVALDLINTLGIGVIVAYAMATGETIFIDVAIVVAMISFLGTIAFAYYVELRVDR